MRTRALRNKLRQLEVRFAEKLRLEALRGVKQNDAPRQYTLEERCAGLCRLRLQLVGGAWRVPAEMVQVAAEYQEAFMHGPVPEALTLRTWEMLTGAPPSLV